MNHSRLIEIEMAKMHVAIFVPFKRIATGILLPTGTTYIRMGDAGFSFQFIVDGLLNLDIVLIFRS